MLSSILVDLIGLGHIQYKRAVLPSGPRLTFRFRLPWAGVFQLLLNSLPRRMRSTFFLLAQTSHSWALIRSVVPNSKLRLVATREMVLVPLLTFLQALSTVIGLMASPMCYGLAFLAAVFLLISYLSVKPRRRPQQLPAHCQSSAPLLPSGLAAS